MAQKIQIIFFDVDGTLIDFGKGTASPRTVEALVRLRKNGVRLCVCTGRSPMKVPVFPGVEFDAFLTYNGSYCYDREGAIFRRPLDQKAVAAILRNAAGLRRPLALATADRLVCNGADDDLREYFSFANSGLAVAADFDQVARRQEIYQIMVGFREAERAALMRGAEGAKIAAWWDRAVDIVPASGGKGVGVRKILEHYHLGPEDAMAFGDGNNDLEMLQAVGHGIAMANGSPELRATADEVCGSASEDGIYHYCVEKRLI